LKHIKDVAGKENGDPVKGAERIYEVVTQTGMFAGKGIYLSTFAIFFLPSPSSFYHLLLSTSSIFFLPSFLLSIFSIFFLSSSCLLSVPISLLFFDLHFNSVRVFHFIPKIQILIEIIAEIPVRVAFGSDCYQTVKGKCERVLKGLEEWKDVTLSTDFPQKNTVDPYVPR
jgi:hypothetical protein